MSRFTGKQYRGAQRDERAAKKTEAERRQQAYEEAGAPSRGLAFRPGRKLRDGELATPAGWPGGAR